MEVGRSHNAYPSVILLNFSMSEILSIFHSEMYVHTTLIC